MSVNDLEKPPPIDDVDFTSGFEKQYEQEYHLLKPKTIVPSMQIPKTMWYRDLHTILMLSFLAGIFLLGIILLTKIVFTSNPWYVCVFISIYLILAIIAILIEVMSVHVR